MRRSKRTSTRSGASFAVASESAARRSAVYLYCPGSTGVGEKGAANSVTGSTSVQRSGLRSRNGAGSLSSDVAARNQPLGSERTSFTRSGRFLSGITPRTSE